MMRKPGGVVCAAKNCVNKTYNSEMRFFNFPKDEGRAWTWLMACGRADLLPKIKNLGSYRLCSLHFENKMFTNIVYKNRLLPTATPTKFPSMEIAMEVEEGSQIKILQNILLEETTSTSTITMDASTFPTPPTVHLPLVSPGSTQTETTLSNRSPRKNKLRKTIKKLRNENDRLKKENEKLQLHLKKLSDEDNLNVTLEQYQSLTYKFCPKDLADFINTQILLIQKHSKGRRYSLEFKNKCLELYFWATLPVCSE
ncbi:hypothetical protein RI129_006513 [Pyrocoelia pectoralis]|uniref:THAP-type domain-containing protein n=1 Tax=Pyrocoelia pectoralis TaxID=417401 RepID=A0AAN7VH30_9COLE